MSLNAIGVGHLALVHELARPGTDLLTARHGTARGPTDLIVPDTTGHFLASDAWRCSDQREQRDHEAERAQGDDRRRRLLGFAESRRDEFRELMQADRRTEHDRQHDRRADAEAAPQALRQVALQHRLVRMQRIVIDGDDGADRIFRDGFGDLEISEVLADADAVVAQLLAGDGIFVDDVGEVALLEAMPLLRGRCRSPRPCAPRPSRPPPCPRVDGHSRAARTCSVL